mmetsp:Transcript_149681/g.264226  ORF Transcript_149681/g.264226 Transcript_149681/m.264226 type:complete len:422 (-) Transcript_149681:78-1343(-)
MLLRVVGLLCACIASLSEADTQQETVGKDHIIKLEHDSAAAKGMMRRQHVSKHDHHQHYAVTASGSLSADVRGAVSNTRNAPANSSVAMKLDQVDGTANASKNASATNKTNLLKDGVNGTGNGTGNSSQPAKGSCFIAKGLKVINLKDGKGDTFQMVIREDQDDVSRRLEKDGHYQIHKPEDLSALAGKPMPPSGTLLDIGASMGWYTMLFARAGYKVIAIEPILLNQAALNATLCLNPKAAANVQILPIALVSQQDRKKTCVMQPRADDNQGAGTLSCSMRAEELPCRPSEALLNESNHTGRPCYGITVNTLDVLLSQMAPIIVDFVKIDVDGMECDVMTAGESVFWRYNVKFLQVTTQRTPVAQCFVREAKKHGYIVGKHEGDDLNKVMYRHSEMVALTEGAVKELKQPTTFTLHKAFG